MLDGLRLDQAHVLSGLSHSGTSRPHGFRKCGIGYKLCVAGGRRSTFAATRLPSADRIERQQDYDILLHRGAIGSVSRNQEAPAWPFGAHANRSATKRVVSGFDTSNEIAGVQARLRRDVD
jgi:hypothetical protein